MWAKMADALLLPWIDLNEAIVVGAVTFHPFDVALELAGENAQALREYGSIYIDGCRLPLAIEHGENSLPIIRVGPGTHMEGP